MYGYFSQKQLDCNGIVYIYKDVNENEFRLTEISNNLFTEDELTRYFKDKIFVSEVFEFVRVEKIDKDLKIIR